MSSNTTADVSNSAPTAPKSKKSKKKKGGKSKTNGETQKANGITPDEVHEDDGEVEETETQTPTEPPTPTSARKPDYPILKPPANGIHADFDDDAPNAFKPEQASHQRSTRRASLVQPPSSDQPRVKDQQESTEMPNGSDTRLEALRQEREALREEVAQVRKSLEELQAKHEDELTGIKEQLEETQNGKEQAESQYRSLLGKVNTIRSQLGDRLKADAEDLAQARTRIEELEEQNNGLKEQNDSRETEVASLAEQMEQQSKELSSLRNRTLLSQENFGKEREDLLQREANAKEEFETAKQAMQDWEILAMEERSIRESIQEKVSDLEEQLENHREAHDRAAAERDTQSSTVDGLQRALQELQDARRKELREIVENSQAQVERLQKRVKESENKASEAISKLEFTQHDLEQAIPFEKEVKEKNLLIGKLRHEAVILNDHLTKALRYLKKGKPEDTIDKQLVTNHFMHFIALDRADPKKFQVLQIIAGLLAWNEGTALAFSHFPFPVLLVFLLYARAATNQPQEQREQAGLARPGASNPNARVPVSPWHRTPSTPALSTDYVFDNSSRKESLADLWSDFLQQEAQEGVKSPKSPGSASVVPSSSASSRPP